MTKLLFRVRYGLALYLALVLLMVSSPGAAGDLVQATNDGSLYLLGRGETARLGVAGSDEQVLELPAGARVYELVATIDGWVATGSLPSENGFDLLVMQDREGGRHTLAPPAGRQGRYRVQAVALVDEGHLAGVAWIEGDQQEVFEVWAAVWDGANFGEPEVVSPVGPGAQLALEGAVLDDGSWLLVWAAVDGEDDEIMWSVRREESWSTPSRLHSDNHVPDVTPALVAIDGGALAAWSWFDGNDYRLRMARFDGEGWSLPEVFGEKGSLEPGFTVHGESVRLLYKTIAPPSWTLEEIDRTGAKTRRAVWSGDITERPLVLGGDEVDAGLQWPQGSGDLDAGRKWPVPWEAEP
ncbi:MAG: hypothetical protein WBG05_11195 [Thermoanaerobaculia bacterium]